jgi:hypothetical protein
MLVFALYPVKLLPHFMRCYSSGRTRADFVTFWVSPPDVIGLRMALPSSLR